MVPSPPSWSARAETRRAAAAAAFGVVLLSATWALLHVGFYTRHVISDTYEYRRYGYLMLNGAVAYRDFVPEYPPGAPPTFVLPSVGTATTTAGHDAFTAYAEPTRSPPMLSLQRASVRSYPADGAVRMAVHAEPSLPTATISTYRKTIGENDMLASIAMMARH